MKKLFLIFSLFFLFLITVAPSVQAESICTIVKNEGLVTCGGPNKPPCTICLFFEMLSRVLNFILFCIVPPLAVLMIAIGGAMLIIGYAGPAEMIEGKQGGPAMISRAKRLFKSVVMGLLIIYGAWVIVNFFLQIIGVTIWEGGGNWWTIPCN